MEILFTIIGGLVALLALAALVVILHLWKHARLRHRTLFDRQTLFHGSGLFHVASAVKLKSGEDLLSGIGRLVKEIERQGAKVIYAGKVAFPRTRISRQVPDLEWDAHVIAQYSSRRAWDSMVESQAYNDLLDDFTRVWPLGFERSAVQNVAVTMMMLRLRIRHLLSRAPPTYPFEPQDLPEDGLPPVAMDKAALDRAVAEYEPLSRDALVIVNFQKQGNAEQSRRNDRYGASMMSMLAEVGYGPIHLGRAVSLEDDVDFDQVAIISYPGIRYFAEMVRSKFYTGIFGGKQLSDDLTAPTVPILQHLK